MNDIQILKQLLNGYHLNDKELKRASYIHRLLSVNLDTDSRTVKHESGTFNIKDNS